MTQNVRIIGAGQAAAVAARTLRRRGFDGDIALVGEETHPPYQRPPLSKEYLQGNEERDNLFLLTEEWCARNNVELLLDRRAIGLDHSEQVIELADGSRVHGDTVLFATGTRPRRIPHVHGERVHYLRSVDDSDAVRGRIGPGSHIVIIGAGFIGSEVAASARTAGADVTMVEVLDVPLEGALGADLGTVCADIHRQHGVDLRMSETVESVTEGGDGVAVHLASGDVVEGDAVVVGAGVVPNVELAEAAGITVENGIVTDEYCRTSREGVFAAGDVANHYHPLAGRHVRVEHFDNANKQGAVAAKNILGRKVTCEDPHWFWSDQYDLNLQLVGDPGRRTELVIRGSVDDLDFVAFGLEDGVPRSAFAVERGGEVAIATELIAQQVVVDPAALCNEGTDLAALLPDSDL